MNTRPALVLPERMPRLDGLRGIAILLVLFHQLDRLDGVGLAARIVDRGLDFGWVGVQLFFVLSGFLISGILLDIRGREHAYRDFLARRALRIFPLYFAALAMFTLVLPALGLVPTEWREHSLWYWLYLSNWTQPYVGGALPHLWSLAVEEQFYVVWPFIALRASPRSLLRICIGVAMVSVLARAGMLLLGVDREAVYTSSLSRMDALCLGAAAAAWLRVPGNLEAGHAYRGRILAVAAGLALVGLVPSGFYARIGIGGQVIGYSVLALTFALVIVLLALDDARPEGASATRWFANPVLRTLGKYSYGMYVFHKPLHDLLGKPLLVAWGYPEKMPLGPGLIYIGGAIAVVAVAGALSYELFERHFLELRGRFPAGRGVAA